MIAGVTLATMMLASCANTVPGVAESAATSTTGSVASGPSKPSAPTTTTAHAANVNDGPFKIGDEVKFDRSLVGKVKKIQSLSASSDGFPADSGNRYVGVEIEVTNSGADTDVFALLLQAELKDPDGKIYDATPLSGHKPEAPNGEIKPKQTLSGLVVFEVPTKYTFSSGAAAGFVFLFKGGPGANESVEIKLG